nr:MAG TPA: hypothetical protein [Caudoviricetes sp.]
MFEILRYNYPLVDRIASRLKRYSYLYYIEWI